MAFHNHEVLGAAPTSTVVTDSRMSEPLVNADAGLSLGSNTSSEGIEESALQNLNVNHTTFQNSVSGTYHCDIRLTTIRIVRSGGWHPRPQRCLYSQVCTNLLKRMDGPIIDIRKAVSLKSQQGSRTDPYLRIHVAERRGKSWFLPSTQKKYWPLIGRDR